MQLTASDGHEFHVYTAGPEDARSGLIVVQEIFGVNSHIRSVADAFAAQGYRVMSPALFDRVQPGIELGYAADDVKEGLAHRAKIENSQALMDIEACAAAFAPDVKIGIVGYCWGGRLSWLAACQSTRLSAASCWYGGGIVQHKDAKHLMPVQMHFGEEDGSIPMEDVAAIRQAQPDVEIHTYAGAGHGFGCDQRASFEPTAAALARERTLDFFSKLLKQ
ncbi:dienelactone hydrolase family protein [Pusillimonas sp. MFBS29]|uniref:dienelactone hydrolase family protein n=1 Tax=Pusillimonas sp. MFBS29 TaxID=2886690 RepID=UPI001D12B2A1|nr:dienelactone hydrolase family protein [Pusillimonas sp. MFBS29]MCC2596968.1 dienelactone hydrolase family protein [Pusillimonas sp. MFBS29]